MAETARLDPSPDARETAAPVDFAFLAAQTFADLDLQIEVLDLFVAQARRLLPTLPTLDAAAQGDVAHLLKGSARGIGAWPTADAAEAYEIVGPAGRAVASVRLASAIAEAEAAILTWLTHRRVARSPVA